MTRMQGVAVGAFWLGTPLAIALALLLPREVVVDSVAPIFSDRIADILYVYGASALAVLIAAAATLGALIRRKSARLARPSLAACFLPTYVAGIEATHHLTWATRCHPLSGRVDVVADLLYQAQTCALVLTVTIVIGVVIAVAFGHRSRFGLPMDPVVGAILLGTALPWLVVFFLVAARGDYRHSQSRKPPFNGCSGLSQLVSHSVPPAVGPP